VYPRQDARTEKWGYWSNGDWAIAPQYEYASDYCFGFAAIKHYEGCHSLVDVDGRELEIAGLGKRFHCHESFCGFGCDADATRTLIGPVLNNNKEWGTIGTDLVYRPIPLMVWQAASDLYDWGTGDVLIAYGKRDSARYAAYSIERDTMVVPSEMRFEFIWPSCERFWVVKTGVVEPFDDPYHPENVHFYDVMAREIVPGGFEHANPFRQGRAFARNIEDDGCFLFFDSPSNFRRVSYCEVGVFRYDRAYAYDGERGEIAGYIDRDGRWQLTVPYGELSSFDRLGRAIGGKEGKDRTCVLFNMQGDALIEGLAMDTWCGDFPYYEIVRRHNGVEKTEVYDGDLQFLFFA
jgi:hypothetical protein